MEKEKLLALKILIADIVLMSVTVAITYWAAIFIDPAYIGGFENMFYLIAIYDICLLACNAVHPSIAQQRIVKIETIVQRTIIISTLLLLFVSLFTVLLESREHFPRTYTFATVGIFGILSIIERIVIRKVINNSRSKRHDLTPTIIVGNDEVVENLLKVLYTPHYGYDIIGAFYDGNSEFENLNKLKIGDKADLYPYLRQHTEIREIYAYFENGQDSEITALAKYCDNNLIRFFYVPALDIFKNNIAMTILDGIPVIARREEPLSNPINKATKRVFDFIVSSLFLALVFPWILIIVGTIIKIKSPGPIFFKQKRTGLDGKVFNCIKFRTMKVNEESDTLQATENDPRKYPFGDFMRRTNIDEFPQFINVWKGEMSLVGPRPHMLKHTDEYSKIINRFMVRHLAKPGITGLAQVSGFRGETKYIDQMEGRVKKDIEYIETWTFLMDLKIIFKTLTNMFGNDENAY